MFVEKLNIFLSFVFSFLNVAKNIRIVSRVIKREEKFKKTIIFKKQKNLYLLGPNILVYPIILYIPLLISILNVY